MSPLAAAQKSLFGAEMLKRLQPAGASTYLPVLVTIISLVNSLNLIHRSASSSVSLISRSVTSPFSLPFWNSLSTALSRCSRRWSGLEEDIVSLRPGGAWVVRWREVGAQSRFRWDAKGEGRAVFWFLAPARPRHLRAPRGRIGTGGVA